MAAARQIVEDLGLARNIAELQRVPELIGAVEGEIAASRQALEVYRQTELRRAKEDLNMAELLAGTTAPEEATAGKNAEIRSRAMALHLAKDEGLYKAKGALRLCEIEIIQEEANIEISEASRRELLNRFKALCLAVEAGKEMLALYRQAF